MAGLKLKRKLKAKSKSPDIILCMQGLHSCSNKMSDIKGRNVNFTEGE